MREVAKVEKSLFYRSKKVMIWAYRFVFSNSPQKKEKKGATLIILFILAVCKNL
jgi:hypothetical protein